MSITHDRSTHDISQDMTKWCIRAASAIAVAGCMALGAAGPAAADWYLRTGIGLDRPVKTIFTDRDCSTVSPTALYGCGTGNDGAPYRSVGDFGIAIPLELGLGYAVTPAMRIEVLVEYRPRFAFKGRANFPDSGSRQSVAADLSSTAGMLAAYIDLPGLRVPGLGPFVPFVGTGVGIVRTRIGQTRMTFPRRRPSSLVQAGGSGMDGDGGGCGSTERARDGRRGLAVYRPRYRPYRTWCGPGDLAGRKPRTVAARSRRDAGKARGPWIAAVPALFFLRRLHGVNQDDREFWNGTVRAVTPDDADHQCQPAPEQGSQGGAGTGEARRAAGHVNPGCVCFRIRSAVERTNARLKDEFGGRHVRVRGHGKVACPLEEDSLEGFALKTTELPFCSQSPRSDTTNPKIPVPVVRNFARGSMNLIPVPGDWRDGLVVPGKPKSLMRAQDCSCYRNGPQGCVGSPRPAQSPGCLSYPRWVTSTPPQ